MINNKIYGIIYLITNLLNGKIYIGQTVRIGKILEKYYGSGTIINSAIKKYGKENFKKEILEECISKEQLNEREIYWINQLNSLAPNGYNLTPGGTGGDTLSNHPDKKSIRNKMSRKIKQAMKCPSFRQKQSERQSNRFKQNPELKIIYSKMVSERYKNSEYYNSWYIKNIERTSDPKYHKKLSEASKEVHNRPDIIKRKSDSLKLRYQNPKERERLSNAQKKRYKENPRLSENISNKLKGINSPSWKGYVYVYNATGRLIYKFETIKLACKSLKCSDSIITNNYLRNIPIKRGLYKGYTFKLDKTDIPFISQL